MTEKVGRVERILIAAKGANCPSVRIFLPALGSQRGNHLPPPVGHGTNQVQGRREEGQEG
jgi:hypothetical protein